MLVRSCNHLIFDTWVHSQNDKKKHIDEDEGNLEGESLDYN